MIKITSLFLAGAAIVISPFLSNRAANAAVIIDDTAPGLCELTSEENNQNRVECNGFKLIRNGNGVRFEFLFEDFRTIHLAVSSDNPEILENNGTTFVTYPTVLQTIERPGDEPISTGTSGGLCAITTDNTVVMCQVLGFNYTYAGDMMPLPDGVGSGANNPAITPPSNVNQYEFETSSHTNTGVSVNPGDVVNIEASGTIRFGFFAGSGGPRGIFFNPDYNYFIDLLHGQLMGRVRQFGMGEFDGWFPIGEGTQFVVQNQGVLEFAVNDNQPSDNAGGFQINVTIESGQN